MIHEHSFVKFRLGKNKACLFNPVFFPFERDLAPQIRPLFSVCGMFLMKKKRVYKRARDMFF